MSARRRSRVVAYLLREHLNTQSTRARSVVDAPLYVCGEALDIDADCGGFNLAWAWLSGIRAASSL